MWLVPVKCSFWWSTIHNFHKCLVPLYKCARKVLCQAKSWQQSSDKGSRSTPSTVSIMQSPLIKLANEKDARVTSFRLEKACTLSHSCFHVSELCFSTWLSSGHCLLTSATVSHRLLQHPRILKPLPPVWKVSALQRMIHSSSHPSWDFAGVPFYHI